MQHRSTSQSPPPSLSALTRSPLWRGIVGCVVAYALVITAVLSSVVQAEWAAAGLVGEHCATDARAAGVDPEAPAGQPHDESHCALCTLAAGPAVLPAALAFAFIALPRAVMPAGGNDRDLVDWFGHPAKLPRGPPYAAVAA